MQEAVEPEDREDQTEQNTDYRDSRFHQSNLFYDRCLPLLCDGIAKLSRACHSVQEISKPEFPYMDPARLPKRLERDELNPMTSIYPASVNGAVAIAPGSDGFPRVLIALPFCFL
jgi:hypothetical protein